MSTRAIIGKVISETSIRYVFLGRDGYPESAGDLLVNCYDTARKIDELLAGGNLSDLEGTVLKCRFYNEPAEIIAIDADKAEPAFIPLIRNNNLDFGYLFIDDRWKCWESDGEEVDLAEELAQVPLNNARGLLEYIVAQTEAIEQAVASPTSSYTPLKQRVAVHFNNIKSACKEIDRDLLNYK